MGYIKKLKNNELVGGTDKITVYPVTSTEAVFEEVIEDGESNFKSQKFLNNNITGDRINKETITDYNIAVGTVTKGKLTPQVQTMLDEGQKKALTPKGNYNPETEYEALDLVFDPLPGTNSSYISLQTPNVGHPVDENAEGYEEGWWEKTLDGTAVNTAQAAIDAKVDELDAQVDQAIEAARQELQDATNAANGAAELAMDVVANKVADAQVGYFECNTATGTALKQTTFDYIGTGDDKSYYTIPAAGSNVRIKMKYANTATDTAELQFGTNTATRKPLIYNGEPASQSNTWDDGEVLSIYYDPTYNNNTGAYQASNAQGGGSAIGKKKLGYTGYGLVLVTNVVGVDDKYYLAETPTASTNYKYIKQSVNPGDVIQVSGTGGANARLWAIAKETGEVIDMAVVDSIHNNTNAINKVLVMPPDAAWVVLNGLKTDTDWYYAKAGSVGAHEMLTEAYLYTDVQELSLGNNYSVGEVVKTPNNEIVRINKEITSLDLISTVTIEDLKTYDGSTYKALHAVNAYDGTETEGLYAIGSPAGADIQVTVDSEVIALLEEETPIEISIAGIGLTVNIASTDSASDIAAKISTEFGTQDEWSLTDNQDGTLTLKSKVGKATAPTVSSSTGTTGVTIGIVEDSSYAGSISLNKYTEGQWSTVTPANWVADTEIWEELPINILITKYTTQDSIYKDIDNISVIRHNVFDFNTATPNTNNTSNITPTKTSNGFTWTVKKKDTGNARQASLKISQIDASKQYLSTARTYKVSFDFVYTLTASTLVTVYLDTYSQAGTNPGDITTGQRHQLSSDLLHEYPSKHFEKEIFVTRTDVEYITLRFVQPAVGQYISISNVLVEEVKVVKDTVDAVEDFIYDNKKLISVGLLYNKGDEVITTDRAIRVLNKDVSLMALDEEVIVGDLKVYGSNTYIALKNISSYDESIQYHIGDYALKDNVVKQYDGTSWTAKTLANLSADTSVYKALTIKELEEYTKQSSIPKLYNDFGINTDGAVSQDKLFYELHDFNTLSFPAVITGRKIDGTNGKWSTSNEHKYYLFPVEPGQVYRITANATYYANYAWLISVPVNTTSGGTPPYAPGESNQYQVKAGQTRDIQVPLGTKYMYIFSALKTGEVYRPSSVAIARPIVSTSSERLNTLEKGTPYTLPRLLKLAKYRTDAIKNISILHYSDLHADTIAFNELKEVYNEYGDTFDAILETGDRTYTVATGAAPNLADEVLFVPGNHDVCDGTGTAGYSWPAYTPEYLFNKFVAPYKDARGITLPEGWNVEGDPHQNALYWYKDFDNGADKVRIIGIDCMRYYHMNENESEFDNDAQEKWLCDTLADAQTNGFKVIVASHYSLDDYSGAYAKWDEENHVWKYNYVDDPVNNTGGHVMNRMTNTPVGFHNRTTTSFTSSNTQHLRNRTSRNSKGQINNFGDIITAWIEGGSAFNNYITFPGGGVFIAWICGHLHNNIMFYPTRYPKILNIVTTCAGTTMWGYNTDTPSVNRREDTIYRRLSANAYFIQGNYLKIVRIGNNLSNGLLVPSTWMTINYVTGEVITEG